MPYLLYCLLMSSNSQFIGPNLEKPNIKNVQSSKSPTNTLTLISLSSSSFLQTAATATSPSFFNWLCSLLLTFFSLSGYNIVLQLTAIPLTLTTLVSMGTLGSRVLTNFFTNLSEPIRERTANGFARTNSRFATQPTNYVTMVWCTSF